MLRRLLVTGVQIRIAQRCISGIGPGRSLLTGRKTSSPSPNQTVQQIKVSTNGGFKSLRSSPKLSKRFLCTSLETPKPESNAKSLMAGLLANVQPGYPVDYVMSFQKYVSEDQRATIRELTEKIANSYNESISEVDGTITLSSSGDKRDIRSAMFYGMSGSGKTRLALELMDLMRRSLNEKQSPTVAERYLRDRLSKPRTIYINWGRNGTRYDGSEEHDWSAQLIVGARVAAKYWFKEHHFDVVRQKINELSPQEKQLFEYSNVLDAIAAENKAKNDKDKISAIHIINDEFHIAAAVDIAYCGSKSSQATESLSRAVARVLTERNRPQLFTFSTFVGLGFRYEDIFENVSDGECPPYCVRRLSIKSSKKIITEELGPQWTASPHLDKVLATLGGNARMLEVLIQNIRPLKSPEEFYSIEALDNLKQAISGRFKTELLTTYPLIWPTLLSLAGYNIKTTNMIVSETDTMCMTATDIAKTSLISLRGPNSNERWLGWDYSLVMDMPLILAKWTLSYINANKLQAPKNPGVKRPNATQWMALIQQAEDITDYFYLGPYQFEILVLKQLVFRWNMHNFSEPLCVKAAQLFNGGHCTEKFRRRRFKLEKNVISLPKVSVLGVWAEGTNPKPKLVPQVTLQSQNKVDISLKEKFRAIHFGGKNLFDGYLLLEEKGTGKTVIVWVDAKHTERKDGTSKSLTQAEITELKEKLRSLTNAPKFSQYLQLLVVVSNCTYTPPKVPTTDDMDDYICIIARDGLTFGTSPWISLIAQTIKDTDSDKQTDKTDK